MSHQRFTSVYQCFTSVSPEFHKFSPMFQDSVLKRFISVPKVFRIYLFVIEATWAYEGLVFLLKDLMKKVFTYSARIINQVILNSGFLKKKSRRRNSRRNNKIDWEVQLWQRHQHCFSGVWKLDELSQTPKIQFNKQLGSCSSSKICCWMQQVAMWMRKA